MWLRRYGYEYIYILCLTQMTRVSSDGPIWNWECENDKQCVKKSLTDNKKSDVPVFSLEECKMFCDKYGVLWPRPTVHTDLGNFLSKINVNEINFIIIKHGKSEDLLTAAIQRFKSLIALTIPKGVRVQSGKAIDIFLINKDPHVTELKLNVNESYILTVAPESSPRLNATIVGSTFFGVRHGLETLSQLFIYDENINHMLLPRDVIIKDKPAYTYRGLLLDTSRHYFSVESIKNTIDAMAAVKMNTFHWHITDSQSFPLVLEKRPELAKYGAYSPAKVYTKQDVRAVVQFAASRGVRVLPELDAPGHVGEGWPDYLTTCFKFQPYDDYCVEPPCGQLNPIKDELYDYLEDIYTEMAESFKTDLFHMGGDEVSEVCWTSEPEIWSFMEQMGWTNSTEGFLELWSYFQKKAKERAQKAFGKNTTLIMWTSTLTNSQKVQKYLSKDQYIIQVWGRSKDPKTKELLSKGYRLIMSNHDSLYLDCGFGAWLSKGPAWCEHSNWQNIYDNNLAKGIRKYRDQILGGEVAVWSEKIEEATLDNRVWPRTAALAERLWSDPYTEYSSAVNRLHSMRGAELRKISSMEYLKSAGGADFRIWVVPKVGAVK